MWTQGFYHSLSQFKCYHKAMDNSQKESRFKKNTQKRPDRSNKLKGLRKKKNTCFKKGVAHKRTFQETDTDVLNEVAIQPLKRPCKRYSQDYFDVFIKETPTNKLGIPGADGKDGNAIVLRPRPNDQEATEPGQSSKSRYYNMKEGNILVEKSRLSKLINLCNKEHKDLQECEAVDAWDLVDFESWGVYSRVVYTCLECGFRSERTNLFEDLPTKKPGRRSAVGNTRLQLMLQDTPIGPTEAQLLFAAVGLNAGSLSSMQKGAYKAALATENVNHEDMLKWRSVVMDVLQNRGVLSFNHISGGFDVRYNGSSLSSSVTPGPGATMGVGLFVEKVTSQQKCLGLDYQNMLCPIGARLRSKGVDIICGEGPIEERHNGCTATLPPGRHISEYTAAENIAEDLYFDSGISVTHLVTDSDGTGRNAFRDVNEYVDGNLPELTWYKDLMHVGWNMYHKIKSHSFSAGSFGTKPNGTSWNYLERKDCSKALAMDVQERTARTMKRALEHFKGDLDRFKNNSEKICTYMVDCYQGNHKSCRSAPIARLTGCNGNYFATSSNLSAQNISSLNLEVTDKSFLEAVIKMKLGKDSVQFFSRRLTTSRNESMNKAISKSSAKNRLNVRTGKGRVSSAILRQNNTFEEAVKMKFQAMNCPMKPGEICDKVVKKYQRKRNNTLASQQKPSAVARKRLRRKQRNQDYYHQRTRVTNKGEYIKNQLDRAYASKDAAFSKIVDTAVASTSSEEAMVSTSLEDNLRHAAIRVRRTQRAYKTWSDYIEKSANDFDESLAKKKVTKKKMKASAQRRCANKSAARKQRKTLHGDHTYGK